MTRTSAMWLAAFAAQAGAWFCVPCNASAQPLPTTTWPQYQYSSDHNAVFDSPDWSVSWKAQAGDIVNGGLSIVGTTLYFESFDHYIYAVDALTGKERWQIKLDDVVMTTPLVADGLVFVGSGTNRMQPPDGLPDPLSGRPDGNHIYALSETSGEIAWKFATVGQNMPTPVFTTIGGKDAIVFASGDQHVYGLEAQTGKMMWAQSTAGTDLMASLALDNGLVYGITGYRSDYYDHTYKKYGRAAALASYQHTWAIDARDGDYSWTRAVGERGGSPTVAGAKVFVESWLPENADNPGLWVDPRYYPFWKVAAWARLVVGPTPTHNEVVALDAKSGRLVWLRRFEPGIATIDGSHQDSVAGLASDGRFYESLPVNREFVAFDAQTGRIIWSIKTPEPVKMSAIEKSGLLYFSDAGHSLYVVRASDGSVLHRVTFPGTFGISPPLIVGQTLFVSNGNSVYAVPLVDLRRGVGPTS